MDVHKKQNFIISDNTSTRWVKPAPPTEPIFLIPTLLMRGPKLFYASNVIIGRSVESQLECKSLQVESRVYEVESSNFVQMTRVQSTFFYSDLSGVSDSCLFNTCACICAYFNSS